jgi:hypothetical protein
MSQPAKDVREDLLVPIELTAMAASSVFCGEHQDVRTAIRTE